MSPQECYIYTRSGQKFFPLLPEPEKILIEDISWALSHICRFTGHVSSFYSVAQHSVLVSLECPKKLALAGLLHDASEAYLCDVSSPVKKLDSMRTYREAEEKLQATIYAKFGVPFTIPPPKVKEADQTIYRTEVHHLMPYQESGKTSTSIGSFQAWSPEKSRDEFLKRYGILTGNKSSKKL